MVKKAKYRLESYYKQDATSGEKEVLRYILKNTREVVEMDIHTLAKRGFCSAATIVRICKKNGFTGYRALKMALLNDLNYSDEFMQSHLVPKEKDDIRSIISNVLNENIQAIQNTYSLLDLAELNSVVQCLQDAPYVYLFGIGASYLVARDLNFKLERVGKRSILYEDHHMQLVASNNVSPKDLAIIISYSGMTQEILEIAKNIRDNGGKILSITQYGANRLMQLSNFTLYVPKIEAPLRTSASSSRISQLNIVDILFHTYMYYITEESEESMEKIITTQQQLQKELDDES